MNLKYILVFLLFLVTGLGVKAQNNTNSPYSMFGIGYIEPGGFGRNKAMGGTGIALPSKTSLNNINPASYHALDSLIFLTETGLNGIYSKFTNGSQVQNNFNMNFSYLALGFRITRRWSSSIGATPYSNIGYSIDTKKQIEGTTNYSDINVSGSGGLNQIYWGNAFKVTKNLSLGVNASYLFGSITQTEKTSNDYLSGTIDVTDESRLRNFYLNYGLQYSFKVNKNIEGMVGAVYGNKTRLRLKHNTNIVDNNGDTLSSNVASKSNFYIPQYYGFGASVKFYNKLLITGDYTRNNWSGSNPGKSVIQLVNSDNYALGVEYIPSYKPSANYLHVLRYRLGAYKENSYMNIKGNQMNDVGITAGIGFPVSKGKTYINLAVALGKKGSGGAGGIITENYCKINLNISLLDIWFVRSKFD